MVQCQQCGTDIGITKKRFCVNCKKIRDKESWRRYSQSEKGKAIRYSEKRKTYQKEHYRDREFSEKRKAYRKAYWKKYRNLNNTISPNAMPFQGLPFQLFLIDYEHFANSTEGREQRRQIRKFDFRKLIFESLIHPRLVSGTEYLIMWFGGASFFPDKTEDAHNLLFLETKLNKRDPHTGLKSYASSDPRITGKAFEYLAKYPKQITMTYLGAGDIDLFSVVEACIAQNKPIGILANHSRDLHTDYNDVPQLWGNIYFLHK